MAVNPTPYALVNGELRPAEETGFPLGHQSLVDALGIYETVLVEGGRFFHLDWHLRRLRQSAEILGIELPGSLEEIGRWARQLLATVAGGEGLLRIVAYGGDGVYPPVCGLYVKPMIRWPAEAHSQGILVTTSGGERFLPLAKSTNCLAQALARRRARQAGGYEGLIVDRHGHVTEGSASNFLVIRDGELLRPLAGTALDGITEAITLNLAAAVGIAVRRAALSLAEATRWDEAFVTSSTRRIMPVRQLDGVMLPASPGRVTLRLMEAYRAYEAENGWEQ